MRESSLLISVVCSSGCSELQLVKTANGKTFENSQLIIAISTVNYNEKPQFHFFWQRDNANESFLEHIIFFFVFFLFIQFYKTLNFSK